MRWPSAALLLLTACTGSPADAPKPDTDDTGTDAEPGCAPAPPDEGDGWPVGAPADHDLDAERLCALREALEAGDVPYIDSLHIVRGGTLVFEAQLRTGTDNFDVPWNDDPDVHTLQSATKSVSAMLVGAAMLHGDMQGLDDPMLSYFPAYTDLDNPDPRKQAWTLHDFLSMQAGLDWDEWGAPWGDPDNDLWATYTYELDYTRALMDRPLVADPGTRFTYCTICTYSLGAAVENATGTALADFAEAALLGPLGITSTTWIETPEGLPNLGGGLYLTGRDAARLGLLVAQDGVWGEERLLPAGWAAQMSAAHVQFGPELAGLGEGYGYQWWRDDLERDGTPLGIFSAQGYGGQAIYVWPDADLVVVFTGRNWGEEATTRSVPHEVMADWIIPATR